MPRKKFVPRAKKLLLKNYVSASLQKMEKNFLDVPVKLTAKLQKEVSAVGKTETKLKNHVSKARTQLKACETRMKLAMKAKSTPLNKKKITLAKKLYLEANHTLTTLNKQLPEVTKQHQALLNKQAKLAALCDYINQFEKNWTKKQKKTKIKPVKKAAKPIVPTIKHALQKTELPDVTLGNVLVDETVDTYS